MSQSCKDQGFATGERIEELLAKIAKLEAEREKNPEIEDLKNKLNNKEEEKKKILDMFDELTNQFQYQSEELAEETNSRIILISAFQKLSYLNQFLSNKLENLEKRYGKVAGENISLNSKVEKYDLSNQLLKEFSALQKDILRTVPECLFVEVQNIFNNGKNTLSERILQTIALISKEIGGSEASDDNYPTQDTPNNQKEFEQLLSLVSSNFKFITEIIESREKPTWIFKPFSFQEVRNSLLQQIARIENFTQESHIILPDGKSFFDCLLLDIDEYDLKTNLAEALEEISEPKTGEGKFYFALLLQAILANDALRKFGVEARSQVSKQVADIRALKGELEYTKSQIENINTDESIKLNAEIDRLKSENIEITNRYNKLKNAVFIAMEENNDLGEILFDLDIEIPSEKNLMIQKKRHEEIERLNNELETLRNEKAEVEEQYEHLKNESEKSSEEQIELIQRIEAALKETEDRLKETKIGLGREISGLKQENESLRAASSMSQSEFAENLATLKKDTSKIIKALKRENRALAKALDEVQIKSVENINQIKEAFKAKNSLIKATLKSEIEYKEKLKIESERNDKLLNSKIDQLQSLLKVKQEESSQLQTELISTQTQLNNTLIENKMLSTRIISKEERAKRDVSVMESKCRLRIMALETECQARIEQIKAESNNNSGEFYSEVVSFFSDYLKPKSPKEKVIEIVKKAAECLSKYDSVVNSLNEAITEISSTKRILQATKSTTLQAAAAEAVEAINKQSSEINTLNARIKGMKREVIEARSVSQYDRTNKEWEDWARRMNMIVSDGFCSVGNVKEVRFALEEAIFGSLGNRIVSRRLDSLRTQKKLILRGAQNVKPSTQQSVRVITKIAIFVRRIQRLSGHVMTAMTLEGPPEEVIVPKGPLFSTFVLKPNM